jgi:hypothetical protein
MEGGAMASIEAVAVNGLEIEEFTLIPKRGLQTTLRNGFFLCYIPTKMLQENTAIRWVYMTHEELIELARGNVLGSVYDRVLPYVNKYWKGENNE